MGLLDELEKWNRRAGSLASGTYDLRGLCPTSARTWASSGPGYCLPGMPRAR